MKYAQFSKMMGSFHFKRNLVNQFHQFFNPHFNEKENNIQLGKEVKR